MSGKQLKRTLLMGAGCAVFLLAGIVYSLLYNDGRWVMEMNLEEYVFSAKDIPMLAAGMPVALGPALRLGKHQLEGAFLLGRDGDAGTLFHFVGASQKRRERPAGKQPG